MNKKISVNEAAELDRQFENSSTEKVLEWAWREFGGLPLPVFTLDTGLLFPETIELKKRLEDFFKIRIESLEPALTVEQQAAEHGPELWKTKPDDCCWMRKVVPLQKKLATLDVWVTGLRRDQSGTRRGIGILEVYEFDPVLNRDILKLNPLARWKREEVWDYLKKNRIPYNPLHDRGYRSIGCVPCTKPVSEGEDDRAGRWIGFQKTECGIHTFLEKKK